MGRIKSLATTPFYPRYQYALEHEEGTSITPNKRCKYQHGEVCNQQVCQFFNKRCMYFKCNYYKFTTQRKAVIEKLKDKRIHAECIYSKNKCKCEKFSATVCKFEVPFYCDYYTTSKQMESEKNKENKELPKAISSPMCQFYSHGKCKLQLVRNFDNKCNLRKCRFYWFQNSKKWYCKFLKERKFGSCAFYLKRHRCKKYKDIECTEQVNTYCDYYLTVKQYDLLLKTNQNKKHGSRSEIERKTKPKIAG